MDEFLEDVVWTGSTVEEEVSVTEGFDGLLDDPATILNPVTELTEQDDIFKGFSSQGLVVDVVEF